jgi:HD superfamily phosphohydrolase
MASKKKTKLDQPALFSKDSLAVPAPNFLALLKRPAIALPLPLDFKAEEEAENLERLWQDASNIQKYRFEEFIHAGGSGLVFRVKEMTGGADWAMKIARLKAFQPQKDTNLEESPFSEAEIAALQQVSHPNVVSLHERISSARGVVALVTTYVPHPQPLDEYLRLTFAKEPKGRGLASFSPERLDGACSFLVQRFAEMASALDHMHGRRLFHCDVKPANILITGAPWKAILTDLGSCVSIKGDTPLELRIHFTWTYAHPDLTNLRKDVRGISGGGLKASALVDAAKLEAYDLFALGRTIQESLATLVDEFGERCFAAYGFRFLHLIACLLLDGKNAPGNQRVEDVSGHRFVSDKALDYATDLFEQHKVRTAADLAERLSRYSKDYSWNGRIPELDPWQPDYVNTGSGPSAPYTKRVLEIFKHPAVRRLRSELQLGWVRDVYPGATHTRWSHTLGVFANVCSYFSALLSDPELPTARIILETGDIEHALVAALIHDVGQTAFGHDFEVINSTAFNHERLVPDLLHDKSLSSMSLAEVIHKHWPRVDVDRVLRILGVEAARSKGNKDGGAPPALAVDGLARDMINGPIDADKLDYLMRDAAACGVPYGAGIDRGRFLKALTVDVKQMLALAYRAKGAAAVESLLLARYQMYSAVYWHHTYRCIQAMLVQAVSTTFVRTMVPTVSSKVKDLFFRRVVLRQHVDFARELGSHFKDRRSFTPPADVAVEPSLEFAWQFADSKNRKLLERVARRELYKRAYEIRTGELGKQVDYAALQEKLAPDKRPSIAEALEGFFLRAIKRKISDRKGPTESTAESQARSLAQTLSDADLPLVVIDYPVRGIPDDRNIPLEIGDPSRKYISGATVGATAGRDVFVNVRRLQIESASVRVFCEYSLHQLIVRYLGPSDVQACVLEAMPFLTVQQ